MMDYKRELLKGNTECLLLCLINSQSMYGYQLIKELNRRSNGYFHFKEGTLYPALHRLEKEKLISGDWKKSPAGQERRYYHITGKGRRALFQKLSVWEDFATAIRAVVQPRTS